MSEKEIKFKPFDVPQGAIENPDNINCRGMQFWKNKKNGFAVAITHFTSDPQKRTEEWFKQATQNMRQDQCDREYHIDFSSKSGQKAFWYLAAEPERYLRDDIDLKTIPKSWRIIASLDYGTKNPTAILISAVDQQNRFHFVWEFYKPSSVKEIAEVLKGTHPDYPHPLWKRIEKVMADPSIWKGDQNIEGKEEMDSVADLLEQKGIYNLERGTNNRIAGLDRIHELFNYKPNSPDAKPHMFIYKRCKNFWREMCGLVYEEIPAHLLLKKNQKEDVVGKDDHCVVAGTMISTDRGKIPVENIRVGDMVLTRNGYQPVESCGITGIKQTIKLSFSNGSELICTGNHPIYTKNRGFIRADELSSSDIFLSEDEWTEKKSSLMEKYLGVIQNLRRQEDILGVINPTLFFIEKFGNSIMEKFQKATRFIIKMETPSIMIFQTSNAYQCMTISPSTIGSLETKRKNAIFVLKNFLSATIQKAGLDFVQESAEQKCMQKKEDSRLSLSARCAELLKGKKIKERAKPVRLNAVGFLEKKETVYNLSVKYFPEYFANEILIHNCYDSARYNVMSLTEPAGDDPEPPPGEFTLAQMEKDMDNFEDDDGIDFF